MTEQKKRFGQCDRTTKTISLSKELTRINDISKVKDTILHEIAHALTKGGHNREWKLMVKIKKIIHQVWCEGKLISKHKSFWHAQTAVEKHLRSGKINNNYCIETVIKKEVNYV